MTLSCLTARLDAFHRARTRTKRRSHRSPAERLEPRYCLTDISSADHDITNDQIWNTSLHAADFDGDGDLDLLASTYLGTTAWYENTDGYASGYASVLRGPIGYLVLGRSHPRRSPFERDLAWHRTYGVRSAN